jgi:hypothetical protein
MPPSRAAYRYAAGKHDRAAPARNRQAGCSTRPTAARDLALDQFAELADRDANAGFVLALRDLHAGDVVPGAHRHATVDRDRPHRRVRKHETQRRPGAIDELRHDRFEVMAIGAQAMQPDHGVTRIRRSFEFDGWEGHWCGIPVEGAMVPELGARG